MNTILLSYVTYRLVSMSATLPKGHYVVFPSTFYPNQEIRFWLTFYTEKKSVRIHEIAPYKETITKVCDVLLMFLVLVSIDFV